METMNCSQKRKPPYGGTVGTASGTGTDNEIKTRMDSERIHTETKTRLQVSTARRDVIKTNPEVWVSSVVNSVVVS